MTTIITKNGSGAPTAGQLSEGELAVDLTNKELYTKSGSTVIKIGGTGGGETGTFTDLTATSSFTSPGIDDNANATAITIDSSENVGIGRDTPSEKLDVMTAENADLGPISIALGGPSTNNRRALWTKDTTTRDMSFYAAAGASTSNTVFYRNNTDESMRIDASGNVGIGTTNPQKELEVHSDGTTQVRLVGGDTGGAILNFGTAAIPADARMVYSNVSKLMQFRTNNGAYALNIDGTGNVGIGTASPDATLTVKPQSAAIGTHENQNWSYDSTNTGVEFDLKLKQVVSSGLVKYKFDLRNSGTSYDNNLVLDRGNVGIGVTDPQHSLDINTGATTRVKTGDGTRSLISGVWSSKPRIQASGADLDITAVGSNAITMQTNGTERMRIDSSGNLLVGTASAGALASPNRGLIDINGSSDSALEFKTAGVTHGYLYESGSEFRVANLTAHPLTFYTDNNERMRLDASGNLQLGITSGSNRRLYLRASANNSTNYACQMENSGAQNLFFVRSDGAFNTGEGTSSPYNNTTAAAANLNVSSNGFLGRSTSSIRYKENVRDYTGSIDALRPVMFNSINEDDDKDYAGFIAEEVHETGLVEFVQYDDQGRPDAVNYANMVALLVKEIQDLKAEVAALKGA
jgi:hypothetical protein